MLGEWAYHHRASEKRRVTRVNNRLEEGVRTSRAKETHGAGEAMEGSASQNTCNVKGTESTFWEGRDVRHWLAERETCTHLAETATSRGATS